MNIQLDSQNQRTTSSILYGIKTNFFRLLKAVYTFVTAKETDKEKRKNELDYFEYIYSDLSEERYK